MRLRVVSLLLLALFVASGSGCAMFGKKPSAEDYVDAPLSPEQQAFWEANRSRARYVVNRGWYVDGVSGYFDEEGRPMREKKAPDTRAVEDDGRDWPGAKYVSLDENIKRFKKLIGKGPNEQLAKKSFEEGEQLFRERKYLEAAKKYKIAYQRWPDSPQEEEAIFKTGEAYFFADRYPKADDHYLMLFKKYPGTLHTNEMVMRQFGMAYYWAGKYAEKPHWPITPNFRDKTLPMFDAAGHAIKLYQEIPKEDPRGPLADDSVMATANFHFVNRHWEEADLSYAELRKEYPRSEFQFYAHYFGLQAKLQTYEGPDYDVSPLEDGDKIAEQLQKQFDRELGEERERIAQVRAEIEAQYALREFQMGEFYYNTHYYAAAKGHYENVIADYPDTRLAQESKSRIESSKDLRQAPPDYFGWVARTLPQSKREGPRLAVLPGSVNPETTTASSASNPANGNPAAGATAGENVIR